MAYIGNTKTPLLLSSNVRDDLLPGYSDPSITSGPFDKKRFLLSQEVPGGDENNVIVIRRKYIVDSLVDVDGLTPPSSIQIHRIHTDSGTIIDITVDNASFDANLAAALSAIQPKSANYEGDLVELSFSGGDSIRQKALEVQYDGSVVSITLSSDVEISGQQTLTGLTSIARSFYAPWEILDSKTDYSIVVSSSGSSDYNKILELKEAPQKDDVVYVLHRGDATYNFVPSPNSVDVDQLSNNLKNFRCDRFVGDDTTTDFELTQKVADPKAILVTLNGIVKEGDDQETVGDWTLVQSATGGLPTVSFKNAPTSSDKIRVLHLGIVSKNIRAAFVPGQQPMYIDAGAITKAKLADNSVDGTKILLDEYKAVKVSYTDGTLGDVLGVSSSDTIISSKGNVRIRLSNSDVVSISSAGILPSTSNSTTLGSSSSKFKDLHISGQANVATLSSTGNASIGGVLSVTGNSTVAALSASTLSTTGNTSVGGTLSVTGASTLSVVSVSSLSTTDSTQVGGTLSVTGASTLANVTAGNTSVGGTLSVTGDSTLSAVSTSSLSTSGNTTVGGTLSVTGASTLASVSASSVSTSANTSVGGTLSVTGASTLAGSLSVTGSASLSSLSATTASTTGNASVGGNLSVTGTSSLTGNTTVAGTLSATGNATLGSNLTLTTGNILLSAAGATVDGVDLSALKAEFDALKATVESLVPIGTIFLWTKSVVPDSKWLVCDGSAVSRQTYSILHGILAAAGYPYGAGDGTNTFNLPDLRRRVAVGRGSDAGWGVLANDGLTDESTRNFSHSHSVPKHKHSIVAASTLAIASSGSHTTKLDHVHQNTVTGVPISSTFLDVYNVGASGDVFAGVKASDGTGAVTNPLTIAEYSLSHKHDINHGHKEATTDLSTYTHSHKVGFGDLGAGSGTAVTIRKLLNYQNATGSNFVDVDTQTYTHSHKITINASTLSTSGLSGLPISSNSIWNSSTNAITSPTDFDLGLKHKHSVRIPEFTGNSLSDGRHIHSPSDFTGCVGNPSDAEGNDGFSTGATTTPYAVVTYIIKAL